MFMVSWGLPLVPFSDKSMSYHVVAFYVLVYVNINLLQCIIDILLYQNNFLSHDPYFWWIRQWFYAWWGRPTCQTIYIYAFSYIYMYIMCVWALFDTIYIYITIYIYMYTHIFLFIHGSILSFVHLSIYRSIYRFISIYPSICFFYCYI